MGNWYEAVDEKGLEANKRGLIVSCEDLFNCTKYVILKVIMQEQSAVWIMKHFFRHSRDLDPRGAGVLKPLEIPKAMSVACEILTTRLKSDSPATRSKTITSEFRGFDIEPVSLYDLQRSEGNVILEYLVRKRTDSFHLKVGISNERAQTLLLNHGNLGMICPSIGRSRYFSSKHHTIVDEVCVQLHCSKKGIIPIGNEHFPITINGYPTDVIESQPYLLSNLRIGDEVSSLTTSGTLGGFVRYLDVYDCFLTCAHVLYDQKTLLDSSSKLPGATAYINTDMDINNVEM
ncbi:unnamed protein product [Mytilus edulis]|uniref:Uncharacterized protein n=1 Tax=Mytilus edulis TaxID=6550 RepID=A0A8S3VBG7_MYTED|nr:unnamed protein product [Mytilus edulis]